MQKMVGFFNAYQLTNDIKYFNKVIELWYFTKEFMIDDENGEWYWKLARIEKFMKICQRLNHGNAHTTILVFVLS
ncbi:MAG: hypothetical protein LRY71_03310 [Bacillaceae bacterium]|nr:hypothetical protein [Bacillaceae bacterium]